MSIAQQVAVNELQRRVGELEVRVRELERAEQSVEAAAAKIEGEDSPAMERPVEQPKRRGRPPKSI